MAVHEAQAPHQNFRIALPVLAERLELLLQKLVLDLLRRLPLQAFFPYGDRGVFVNIPPGLPDIVVDGGKTIRPLFGPLQRHRLAVIILKAVPVILIGVPEEILDVRPLRVIGVLVIGAVKRGGGKAQVVARQRLRVDLPVQRAVSHALGIGQIQKCRQSRKRGPGVQLAVLKAHQHAVRVQPVLPVDHEAAVQHALGHRVGHYGYRLTLFLALLPLLRPLQGAVVHEFHRGPVAGGEAAHGGEGLDVLEAPENGGGHRFVVYLRVERRTVLPVHIQIVYDVGKVGLEEHGGGNPRGGVQKFRDGLIAQVDGRENILV